MTVVLALALGFVVAVYLGYPLWLKLRVRQVPPEQTFTIDDSRLPSMTAIVAAHNEADVIADRVENLLHQNYPADRLNVIVVSDGSTDETAERVAAMASDRVTLLELPASGGKASALNRALEHAHGELLLFADARQTFEPQVARTLAGILVNHPPIGAVSGELILTSDGTPSGADGAGLYWRYEKAIRAMESQTGSVIGVTGAIYAARRALIEPLPPQTILDDVLIPMRLVKLGASVKWCAQARAFDRVSATMDAEFARKVRTLTGNFQLMSLLPWINRPTANPVFGRWFWHKVGRLLVPYALVVVLVSSFLIGQPWATAFGVLQIVIYLLAITGLLAARFRRPIRWLNPASAFLALNAAAVVGLVAFASGQSDQTWKRNPG